MLKQPAANWSMSTSTDRWPPLPVTQVLNDLAAALGHHHKTVLIAPPGAGKTTLVPLALLQADWLDPAKKIVVLEPRRLAARAAASRLATLDRTRLGDRVGYRMRMDTKISDNTRIEIVTEGVFTRMILDDPALEGVGCIVFDEFHERSLDADFGLALALETQAALRDDLRLLIMSATLDGGRVAELLGADVPVIESKGRAYPIELVHRPRQPDQKVEDAVAAAIRFALQNHTGSILAFIPGRAEIERTAQRLSSLTSDNLIIAPLFGAMDIKDQAIAIETPPPGVRKIVLATSIAQTSITIDGVSVVIDSGLSREPVFEPRYQTTRLETVRVSKATADQRAGRAGRTGPGTAIRLWHEGQTRTLRPFDPPEILRTDLSRFMLDAASWGTSKPGQLPLLDLPPEAALAQARENLVNLGALNEQGQLTGKGKQIAAMPLPVNLAAMVSAAPDSENAFQRALLALAITHVATTTREIDLETIMQDLETGGLKKRRKPLAQRARRIVSHLELPENDKNPQSIGRMLLDAYPDRVAMRRGAQAGDFLMANGRGVAVDEHHRLAAERFIIVADLTGKAARSRMLLGASLTLNELEEGLGTLIEEATTVTIGPNGDLNAFRQRRLQALVLSSQLMKLAPGPEIEAALSQWVADKGLDLLPFDDSHLRLLNRLRWLHRQVGAPWPDFDAPVLLEDIDQWLRPYLAGKTALSQLTAAELTAALLGRIDYELHVQIDTLAPAHFLLPTKRQAQLSYDPHKPQPILSVRVQELYGLATHPTVNGGATPLLIELLSPAQRPIQTTNDLPGFWDGSWADVRKEMRGRYPKHVWPENPRAEAPTMRAKPRN
ncbi:MAG: ATP-dependent helicase HrpB [Pseudomonadota bacterium]